MERGQLIGQEPGRGGQGVSGASVQGGLDWTGAQLQYWAVRQAGLSPETLPDVGIYKMAALLTPTVGVREAGTGT